MIKILNNASKTEIAVITVAINEILKEKEIKKEKKISNWFVHSRINKENKSTSKSIWKKYSDF